MKREFYISLGIFIPFALFMAIFYYNEFGSLPKSILFGCLSMSSIFFVPYLFKWVRKKA